MTMKSLRDRINAWMSAVAFAEADDDRTALELVGRSPVRRKEASVDDVMTAVTFAEAGLPDSAREFLGVRRPVETPASVPLALGVPGLNIWYGTATVKI
jgi:hypothetical protein